MKEIINKKMKKIGILLIAICMILSTVVVITADTDDVRPNKISRTSHEIIEKEYYSDYDCDGDLLWDNGPFDGEIAVGNGKGYNTFFGKIWLEACDDFGVDANWIVTDGHFEGICFYENLQVTSIMVRFYEDLGGRPSEIPFYSEDTTDFIESDYYDPNWGEYHVDIDVSFGPVSLSPDVYWVQFTPYGLAGDLFYQGTTTTHYGSYLHVRDGDPNWPGGYGSYWWIEDYILLDLVFQLIGTSSGRPDLDCEGNLSWTDVKPGEIVNGSFEVANIGEPDSLLNWEVKDWPDWGTWTFDPDSGIGLSEGDSITVDVEVIAPDEENTEFTGEIVLVNSYNPDDTCTIPVKLVTPCNLDIGRVWLRGLLFRCNHVGNVNTGMALRLHYIEFTPTEKGTGTVMMNRVIFKDPARTGRMYEFGAGLFTYVIGFFEGGLEIL